MSSYVNINIDGGKKELENYIKFFNNETNETIKLNKKLIIEGEEFNKNNGLKTFVYIIGNNGYGLDYTPFTLEDSDINIIKQNKFRINLCGDGKNNINKEILDVSKMFPKLKFEMWIEYLDRGVFQWIIYKNGEEKIIFIIDEDDDDIKKRKNREIINLHFNDGRDEYYYLNEIFLENYDDNHDYEYEPQDMYEIYRKISKLDKDEIKEIKESDDYEEFVKEIKSWNFNWKEIDGE